MKRCAMLIRQRLPLPVAVCMLLTGPVLAYFSAAILYDLNYLISPELEPTTNDLAFVCIVIGMLMTVVSLIRLNCRLRLSDFFRSH